MNVRCFVSFADDEVMYDGYFASQGGGSAELKGSEMVASGCSHSEGDDAERNQHQGSDRRFGGIYDSSKLVTIDKQAESIGWHTMREYGRHSRAFKEESPAKR